MSHESGLEKLKSIVARGFEEIEKHLRYLHEGSTGIHVGNSELKTEREILDVLRDIREELKPPQKAVSSTLKIRTKQGETSMPLTVHVNDVPGVAVYQEFSSPNGAGIVVPPTGTVAYASDTPSVATVDPVTGQLAYVSAGTATISASDGGNLPASDVLTVSAATAVSSTLTLNPGVAPSPITAAARVKKA